MNLELLLLENKDLEVFKKDMQQSFQVGAIEGTNEYISEDEILTKEDINKSLNNSNAKAYKAVLNDEIVGGAIVNINIQTNINHLDFLYVKNGFQSKGVGQFIWNEIEKLYPNTKIWETVTPYFEKRNIHFYVNRCGFHIVEFYNSKHKDPNSNADEMFKFQKVMK